MEELLLRVRAAKAPSEPAVQDTDSDDVELLHSLLSLLQHPSEQESTVFPALIRELLDWDTSQLDAKRSDKAELKRLSWMAASDLIKNDVIGSDEQLRVLSAMLNDRFASGELLVAVVDCFVNGLDKGFFPCSDDTLALLKQFYVTSDSYDTREKLTSALCRLIVTKDQAKAVVRQGVLRSLLQVVIGEYQNQHHQEEAASTLLSQGVVQVATSIASQVCPSRLEQQEASPTDMCVAVVHLALSRVTLVFEEAMRLLLMLSESSRFAPLLIVAPDLRGVLEKAEQFATKPEGKPIIQDECVRSCSIQLHTTLIPLIDRYEEMHGSLLALRDSSGLLTSPQDAADAALECKAMGNVLFQRGNFAGARAHYRRAIQIVHSAMLQAEEAMATLGIEDLRKQCTVGASVHVAQRDGSVRGGMVSDSVEDDDTVEVLYDGDDDEEERVPLTRVRLRMATAQLEELKTIAVDCAMNTGKAYTMVFDYENAVAAFTLALSRQPQYIAALYHRGVAHLALHDLKQAQLDLRMAHELCGKWKTLSDTTEAKKKKALLAQIVAAYKKLQALHASKKRVDKKLIKQMLGYISSIPGLQEV